MDAAIEALRAAVAIDPLMANAHSDLGAALAQKGDIDAAIRAFRPASRDAALRGFAKNGVEKTLRSRSCP